MPKLIHTKARLLENEQKIMPDLFLCFYTQLFPETNKSIFWASVGRWTFFMGWWAWVGVYIGWVGMGGRLIWVGEWVGMGGGIFWVGRGGWA